MSVTLKKDSWHIKDGNTYRDSAIFSTTLPEDAAAVVAQATSQIDAQEIRANELVADTTADIDTIAASVASMAQLGTDTTLTITGMAADAKATGDALGAQSDRIDDLKSAIEEDEKILKLENPVTIGFATGGTGKFVQYNTGGLYNSGTYNYTDYVDVSKYKQISYKRTGTTAASSNAGIAFYDSGKTFIEGSGIRTLVSQPSTGYASNLYTVDVPTTAKYARFTMFADTETYGNFELYGINEITKQFDVVDSEIDALNEIMSSDNALSGWEIGSFVNTNGTNTNYYGNKQIRSQPIGNLTDTIKVTAKTGYKILLWGWNSTTRNSSTFLGWWKENEFSKTTGSISYFDSSFDILPLINAGAVSVCVTAKRDDDADMTASEGINILITQYVIANINTDISNLENVANDYTMVVAAQTKVAEDWHLPFINVWLGMGLGSNHLIPGTAQIWDESSTTALNQRQIWMSDGVHPFKGAGVTPMYARTISEQLKLVAPSYRNAQGETDVTNPDWTGKTILWMGTSIPAGSDPDAGSGTGATYPALVAQALGATVVNKAKGSSCLRINASTGEYTGMTYGHFLRCVTRTIAECDLLAEDWDNIYSLISGAPSTLPSDNLQTMKNLSFETLIMPYLDGTNDFPDLWVIDYGHNDTANGVDDKRDFWIEPTVENIASGLLAEDTYMTANNYANLATVMGSLSGISDLEAFVAGINRNCFKGAMNFLITLIMKYNPYARIAIVSDYD